MPQQIIALGGAGFSDTLEDLALNRYLIAQTGKLAPKVCFLGQASGEALDYLARFYYGYGRLGCRTTHVSLFECPVARSGPSTVGAGSHLRGRRQHQEHAGAVAGLGGG